MSKIDNQSIINQRPNIDLGNLDLEINCDKNLDKNVNIFNYNDDNSKMINIVFTHNESGDKDIFNYILKIKISSEKKKYFRASALIVAGGGGGGYNIGGGGGGGRVIYYDSFLFNTNTPYNISVGRGGDGGTRDHRHGEDGYTSGLSNILAIGGGGGASQVDNNPLNFVKDDFEIEDIKYGDQEVKGLDGGSGGGSCALQYKEQKQGNAKGMAKEQRKSYDYHSFGNNGGVTYDLEKGEILELRGGGGGGAFEDGENNYSIVNSSMGKGGDGIAIEDIDIGNGVEYKYCPIMSNMDKNINCINYLFDTKYKRRVKKAVGKLYWGAGGGGGSFNTKAGDGGKGGGGGGGYYENKNKLPDMNLIGKGGWNFRNDAIYNEGLKFHIYDGYFNDNMKWFEDGKRLLSQGYAWDGSNKNTFTLNSITKKDYYSVEWFGLFKTKESGIYKFWINSDDASYLWLGDNAISNYTSQNALINNRGVHPMREKTGEKYLDENMYIPIRIQFGERRGGDNIIVSFKTPSSDKKQNGSGFYYSTKKQKTDSSNDGLASSEELNLENMHALTRGGDGEKISGSGGGGGGLGGGGGRGGSGVVILLIETEPEPESNEKIENDVNTQLETLNANFIKNKEFLGINLSKLYHYNIKDNKEFYSYIDKLYQNIIIKSEFAIPFNYDRKIYDSKFHEYIKIVSDLNIEEEPILYYLKEDGTNKYIDNNNLFNYQRLLIIIVDILEDIMVFKREYKDYYKLLKKMKTIEIRYKGINRQNEFDVDINIDSIKIKEENARLESLKTLKEIQKNEIDNKKKTQENSKKIYRLEQEISYLNGKIQDNGKLLGENSSNDLYFTYNKNDNKLILYISDNNNYNIRDFATKLPEKIISIGLFGAEQQNNDVDSFLFDNIQDMYNYNNIDDYITGEDLNNAEKISDFVKIYIYSFLNVNEYNFNRNIITLYIYYSYILVLQTLYRESEKLLVSRNIGSNDDASAVLNARELEKEIFNICGDQPETPSSNQMHGKNYTNGLYDLLKNIDRTVINIKSLNGYGFINRYINYFKINYGIVISNTCPYVTIKFSEYDSERIKQYFRESINYTENRDYTHEEKYYNNLIESFTLEIDKKRFNITKFNYLDHKNISITIEDRLYKICKSESIKKLNRSCMVTEDSPDVEKNKICNIKIIPKDSTFIKEIYQTDVEKIEDYNNKINNYKKDLDNIDKDYNKFKNKHNLIITKNNIYYFIIGILTLSIIFIYIFNITNNTKSIILFIILSVIILLILINYFTRINYEDTIEGFSDRNDEIKNFTYYKITNSHVINSSTEGQYWKIKIELKPRDKDALIYAKKQPDDIELLKNKLKNALVLWKSELGNNEILKIIDFEIDHTSNDNFNKISHITFLSNMNIPDNNIIDVITILKKEDDVFSSLINNHDEYISWTDISKCNMYFQEQVDPFQKEMIRKHKLLHIMTIRNDLLRYINARYLEINKIIDSLELEKANNIYNKVDNVLKNEKKTYDTYKKEYIYKKKYNININNLYIHKILFKSNFLNMLLLFYIIIIVILLLLNIFPNKMYIILTIGFIMMLFNIIIFSSKILHPTRINPNQKYWSKPSSFEK